MKILYNSLLSSRSHKENKDNKDNKDNKEINLEYSE